MKLKFFPLAIVIFFIFLACSQKETPFFSHVYGWLRYNAQDTIGIDGVILTILDVNPDNPSYYRTRYDTTMSHDSHSGFFEMDSVCYGTSGYLSSDLVKIKCDSLQPPLHKNLTWIPTIMGGVDTIFLNLIATMQ